MFSPELDPSRPYVDHLTVFGATGRTSPGRLANGGSFYSPVGSESDTDADADSVPLPSVVLAVSLPDAVSSPLHAQRPTTLSAATPEINRFHVSSIPNLTRLTLGPALGSEKGFHERPGEKDVS